MSLILFALAAATHPSMRPLVKAEKALIEEAVLSELPSPSVLAIGRIPNSGDIVCGRTAGHAFKVFVRRDSKGHIIKAFGASILDGRGGVSEFAALRACHEAGFTTS